MKTSLATSVAAAVLLSLSSAFAIAGSGQAESVQVPGHAYKLAPQEFNNYGAAYSLDTGDTLKLRRQVNRYFTQLKGQPEAEIFGQAPGVFLTSAGTRLEFRDDGDQIVISGLERLPGAVASRTPNAIHYASR